MITSSYPRFAGDGAGSYLRGLAQALVAMGHSVDVVAPHDPLVQLADEQGVRVHRFRYAPLEGLHIAGHGLALEADTRLRRIAPFLMPGFALAALARAHALHRKVGFDVLHAHWAVPGGAIGGAMARADRLPLVITLHGSDVFVIEHNALYARVARFGFDPAARVTGVCQDLLSRAMRVGLAGHLAEVVPCGVDLASFAHGDGTAMRERLGLPPGVPIIGALGRLVSKKGFGCLIECMPDLLQRVPEAHCVIGGVGDLYSILKRRTQELSLPERVILPGQIPWHETRDFYAMCDVVAIPSVVDSQGNVDGLPNVLLEAMASGRAVVASRVAGIPELIDDGHTGLLVPPGDASALASSLSRVLLDDELRGALGRRARGKVTREYGWENIASTYLAIYRAAMAADHSRAPRWTT